MKVSAIVCFYNPNLEQLQKVVQSASKLFDEIILVDDCSDQFIPKIKGVKYVKNIRQLGLEDSRARGVAAASGDIIVFLRDDQELDIQILSQGGRNISTNAKRTKQGPYTS